jgi:multidrug resistance efflux pump
MNEEDWDKRLKETEEESAECREATIKAQMGLERVRLEIELFQMSLNLKTSDYERYKNLEARIRELKEKENKDGFR